MDIVDRSKKNTRISLFVYSLTVCLQFYLVGVLFDGLKYGYVG